LSHSSAKSGLSGAGLYSIVSNISVISICFLCYIKNMLHNYATECIQIFVQSPCNGTRKSEPI
jgi:hypothetical protein